jgi:hypothetical protein
MAKVDKSRQKETLSIEQLNAIDLLVTGKCDREVAEAVGVSRQTVTGWRLYNPYFQAELNRRRKEVWGAAVDRFRSLLLEAVAAVEKAIKQGDAKTALEVLRMAGMDMTKDGSTLGTYLVGEDDPDRILEKEAEKRQHESLYRITPPPSELEKRLVLDELEKQAKELERLLAK